MEIVRIKVGDIVYLNSGSPRLSVCAIDGDKDSGEASVSWISNGELQQARFPLECLRPESPSRESISIRPTANMPLA